MKNCRDNKEGKSFHQHKLAWHKLSRILFKTAEEQAWLGDVTRIKYLLLLQEQEQHNHNQLVIENLRSVELKQPKQIIVWEKLETNITNNIQQQFSHNNLKRQLFLHQPVNLLNMTKLKHA